MGEQCQLVPGPVPAWLTGEAFSSWNQVLTLTLSSRSILPLLVQWDLVSSQCPAINSRTGFGKPQPGAKSALSERFFFFFHF